MSEEQHSPYFSMRTRIGTVTSPKEFVGYKELTVELTYGNMENIIVKNKEDVADIVQNIPLAKKIWDLHDEVVKEGIERGNKFLPTKEDEA
jgi:hypothetical protein